MPTPEILQQLYSLKITSPEFLRVLWVLIKNDEDEKFSSGLEGEELIRLIDFLDNALDTITPSDDIFRQCIRRLQVICGDHMVLPTSHIITGDLVRTGESPIAYGGFADVWEGDHGGNKVCIKALRVFLHDTQGLSKPFFKEAVIWKRLSHPNIVPFLGVTKDPIQFVSEWMPNGTLTQYVNKNPSSNRITLLLGVAEGLNYLHTSYTIHGDLKGSNILVDRDGHARLADFGLASVAQGHNSIASHARGHTARWTAPEILKGAEMITREADMFSFGMVVMETFTGKYPLSEWNVPSVVMKIMGGEWPMYPFGAQKLGFVEPIWGMTINCWQHDPSRRPTIANVVEFLRECYMVHAMDPSMSTLAPWKPSGSTGDSSAYGVISPALSDSGASPPRSPILPNPGSPMPPIHEHSRTQNAAWNPPLSTLDSAGSLTWSTPYPNSSSSFPPHPNSSAQMPPIHEHRQTQGSTFNNLPPGPGSHFSLEDPMSDRYLAAGGTNSFPAMPNRSGHAERQGIKEKQPSLLNKLKALWSVPSVIMRLRHMVKVIMGDGSGR